MTSCEKWRIPLVFVFTFSCGEFKGESVCFLSLTSRGVFLRQLVSTVLLSPCFSISWAVSAWSLVPQSAIAIISGAIFRLSAGYVRLTNAPELSSSKKVLQFQYILVQYLWNVLWCGIYWYGTQRYIAVNNCKANSIASEAEFVLHTFVLVGCSRNSDTSEANFLEG